MGYPSKEVLAAWIDELAPGERHVRRGPGPDGLKRQGQPRNRDWAADALKAVFSMESRDKALENAEFVAKDMESRKLREAAKCLREGIGETTTYLLDDYPREHRRRIRTNNMIERLCISSSRCFVFSHVFFSGLGSCMHFPIFPVARRCSCRT